MKPFGDPGDDPFLLLMYSTMGHVQVERQVGQALGFQPGEFRLAVEEGE